MKNRFTVISATADERAIRKQETALREQGVHLLLKPLDIDNQLQTLHQALQERTN